MFFFHENFLIDDMDVIKIQIIFGFLDGFSRILLDKNFHISLVHQTWSLGKQVPDVPPGPPEPRRGFLVRHSRCRLNDLSQPFMTSGGLQVKTPTKKYFLFFVNLRFENFICYSYIPFNNK